MGSIEEITAARASEAAADIVYFRYRTLKKQFNRNRFPPSTTSQLIDYQLLV